MIFLRHLLMAIGIGLLLVAAAIAAYDLIYSYELDRLVRRVFSKNPPEENVKPRPRISIRWRDAGKIAGGAVLALLMALSIVVVPDGSAGVRVSQISGIRPGTLYAGVHLVVPLIERVSVYDIRE